MPVRNILDIESQLKQGEPVPSGQYYHPDKSGAKICVPKVRQGYGRFELQLKDSSNNTRHLPKGNTDTRSCADFLAEVSSIKNQIAAGTAPEHFINSKPLQALRYSDLFNDHYLPHAKAHKRSWDQDQRLYRLRLEAEFGSKRLDEITRLHVQTFHNQLLAEDYAKSTCNHYIRLLKHSYNLAIDWNLASTNPAKGVKLFREDERQYSLSDVELERLLSVLQSHQNRLVCNVALYLLSTGARVNSALQSRWEHIDRDQRIWHIPASNSKSMKVHSVPLNEVALGVLDALGTEGESEWLFVNPKTGERLQFINKSWGRIRKAAKLSHLRLHDLRHSHASMLVKNGVSLYVVQNILGHSDPRVTQRYAHLSVRDTLESSQLASQQIMLAMEGRAKDA